MSLPSTKCNIGPKNILLKENTCQVVLPYFVLGESEKQGNNLRETRRQKYMLSSSNSNIQTIKTLFSPSF